MSTDEYKRQAAEAALKLVQDGMTLGLGTGSTAAHFVAGLGAMVRDGLNITGIPTSEGARELAQAAGVPLTTPDETTRIDLAVDGADEIDGALQLIKGGGGAHLREKIVARRAEKFVVIADASKCVSQLGAFALPVEITPALWGLTVSEIRAALAECGYENACISLRRLADGGEVLSDNGGYIIDCALDRIVDAERLDLAVRNIPGVVETGLFLGMTDLAFIAGPDGIVQMKP